MQAQHEAKAPGMPKRKGADGRRRGQGGSSRRLPVRGQRICTVHTAVQKGNK